MMQFFMESAVLIKLNVSLGIKVVLLTSVLELRSVLIPINIAVLSSESVQLSEFLGRILTHSIGLFWEGANSYVWVESFAIDHKFEHMTFLH